MLPEYGRLVHEMVKICCEMENREERNLFAPIIIETMKTMTQDKGKLQDDRKYWDHLYLISNKKLDIDSPYGKPEESDIHPVPKKIPYMATDFNRRHYGLILQKLVRQVALMPNSEEKDACVELLANQIKKLLVMNNAENAEDEMVYSDLKTMSEGSIALESGIFDLPEYKDEKTAKSQKKKRTGNGKFYC